MNSCPGTGNHPRCAPPPEIAAAPENPGYPGSSPGAYPERERETLARALRARPSGSEPLSIVDYLYLGQIPSLLFATDAWQDARHRFGGGQDAKQRLQSAIGQITPVRNEIAHVREVDRDRLLRASVACTDVLEMLRGSA
jgi:hypothetical protein